MDYDIKLVNVEIEEAEHPHWRIVLYRFAISSGSANALGDVLLPERGVHIIEQKGKDPHTAARIALERLLKRGRDPFETQILLRIPFGHTEYFSRHGNYEALPTLTDERT
jgi:hypothetical protein